MEATFTRLMARVMTREAKTVRTSAVLLGRLQRRSVKALRNSLVLGADVLELRAWREMDLIAVLMLAVFAAVIAQPLVYGTLGTSVMSLMTPVK